MRRTVAKRIKKKGAWAMHTYRQEKREYVRRRGRQYPKLNVTKRQNRIFKHAVV